MATSSPPSYARPFHTVHTPRLLIRSSIVSDALAVNIIRTEKLNSPFGGVVDPELTLSVQRERIASDAITTAEGKNAWMVIIIKDPQPGDESVEGLRVDEGVLIGNTGFNCFPLKPLLVDSSKEAIVGDTGALIDYRFARKGYAVETMSAVIEYAFVELRCGMISLDTNSENRPFRNLMRTMGIGEGSIRGEGKEQEVLYLFDREMWESAKKQMKSNGKWYL
jgi:RimJ/RimL family protein N-acetyltransferase